jgi:signal peptidase I
MLTTLLTIFVITSLLYGILRWGVFEIIEVDGQSMFPTLTTGQELEIDKINFKFEGLKRGEIIVFNLGDKILVKRVIGLPYETIEIKDKLVNVYTNDKQRYEPLQEVYLNKDINNQPASTCAIANCTILNSKVDLDNQQYFVMGDNRVHSRDSREFGSINKNSIIGVVNIVDRKNKSIFKLPNYKLN